MKIGVIKLGARISFNGRDGAGGGEARSVVRMLHRGGATVHIFTKILKKDELITDYTWHDIEETQFTGGLDALVIINGTVQFYGGAQDRAQILNYLIINQFIGRVFYVYCDPELTLKQVWPSIASKPWAGAWRRADLEISRTDLCYLSQPHDVAAIISSFGKNEIIPAQVRHFPFEKFPCLNNKIPFNEMPAVDLSYGGTMRANRRVKKMIKFYFGHPTTLSVEMFGKIKLENFPPDALLGLSSPSFSGPVPYDEMLVKMNSAAAHCVIGDVYYEKINDVPQRQWESVMAGVVTFIDSDMDKNRRIWAADKTLGDFLYVSDRKELSEKLLLLKSDVNIRREVVQNQYAALNFNEQEYCTDFVRMLE